MLSQFTSRSVNCTSRENDFTRDWMEHCPSSESLAIISCRSFRCRSGGETPVAPLLLPQPLSLIPPSEPTSESLQPLPMQTPRLEWSCLRFRYRSSCVSCHRPRISSNHSCEKRHRHPFLYAARTTVSNIAVVRTFVATVISAVASVLDDENIADVWFYFVDVPNRVGVSSVGIHTTRGLAGRL